MTYFRFQFDCLVLVLFVRSLARFLFGTVSVCITQNFDFTQFWGDLVDSLIFDLLLILSLRCKIISFQEDFVLFHKTVSLVSGAGEFRFV